MSANTETSVVDTPNLKDELGKAAHEPLLPIEKQLISWSLGTGILLLAILAAVNHFVGF